MTHLDILKDVLGVYADEDSWTDETRARDEFPRFEYHGDDGKELPWEFAREALVALDRLRDEVIEIERDAMLLGGLLQSMESPQGDLVGSILKRCRALTQEEE